MSPELTFLPGVPSNHVLHRLREAGGNEVGSGKLINPESSAALAVNTFGWFVERPGQLPPIAGLSNAGVPTMVDVEFCARFPWSGGRHPWLDAVVETDTHLVGVESKRYEPYRDRKTVALSTAYDRPVWGDEMATYQRLRDTLRSGEVSYRYLEAAQLLKHAFGLVTEARRRSRTPVLLYLYAEPKQLAGKVIVRSVFRDHRAEISDFAMRVDGAAVQFIATSYREWLDSWAGVGGPVAAHAKALIERFEL